LTSLSEAVADLRGVAVTLRRLEKQGLGLADAAQGLRRVSNVLGVALQELEALKKNEGYLDKSFDELTLRVEKLEAVGGMSPREAKQYLADAREIRKEDAQK
jgi:hypothetical protein